MNWQKILGLILFPLLSLTAEDLPVQAEGYTINYNTVSIIEYLRFASKICNTNFIYNKNDLDFTVSVISDAPITKDNVMATLVQVLRINGLMLLEQDNSLVIHKAANVRQLATLITGQSQEGQPPIVTRIFRVRNANPESLAAIIRPMISAESLVETSPETHQLIITDVTANVDKVASLIEILDSPHTPLEIKHYNVRNNKIEFLIETANQIMAPLAQGSPFILVPQPFADAIFIVSTPDLTDRGLSVLQTLDIPPKPGFSSSQISGSNVLVYKIEYRTGTDLLIGLNNIGAHLAKTSPHEAELLDSIRDARFVPETNSLMFSGTPSTLNKIKEFLTSLDTPLKHTATTDSFFVYKPRNRSAQEMDKSILEMARNLKSTKGISESLVETLETVKLNPLTNTLVFAGEETNFPRIQELLATIDVPTQTSAIYNFLIYKIIHAPYSAIATSLKSFAANLDKANASENGLIAAIREMKYMEETNSILFTGLEESLKRLSEILPSFDENIAFPPVTNQFFIYKPKNQTGETLATSIQEVIVDLKNNRFTDPSFLQSLQTMKWIKITNSLLFTGDQVSIKRVEDLMQTLDVTAADQKPNYYIYKLQHTSAEVIEEDFDNLLKSFKSSGVKDTRLIDAIENLRHIKETNSFLVTGDAKTIEEVKQLLAEHDYPRAFAKSAQSNFLMYKPQKVPAQQIEKSLKEVAGNLKKSDLADPNLLASIESMKYIEATNALLFTGTPQALEKVQDLLKDTDNPVSQSNSIQAVGKTSFLLYKLKYAGGPQILASIKALSTDLKKAGATDKDLISMLQNVKYIRETNSLLFTGQEESLSHVQSFIEQFDVPALAAPPRHELSEVGTGGSPNFFVYRPVALTGPELEQLVIEFADNLKLSGLSDPDLFQTFQSMRWVEPTQSLIFTGTTKSLNEVKTLLIAFDIPANAPGGVVSTEPLAPSIHGIDNTSFLVYKLQYHKGDEIQTALRQIAKDLINTGAPVNQNLLNSINSIQWIQVTNSLLCSGDQETLTRLRDLVKNLDVPLKQVFIEMLVIETNLLNALQFGLEWGGKYKYRNKFQGTFNNAPSAAADGSCTSTLMQTLNSMIPTVPAQTVTSLMPFGCGFDLGVIGQVIKHNGETFLTLGSLLTAIQTDDETSVIITPKIITQDGRTSSIFVGQNIPFVGSFVNTQGNNTVQTSNIEYRDIGLNLTITPVLGNSDVITLDINLERSQTVTDVTGAALNFSTTSANGIITSKTNMQTTVHVPDKNFLILSGFVNNSNVKSKSGIPCLGGLPFIGAAFSKDNNTSNNSNIVIFLRPHIINSVEDLRQVTTDQEDAFRDQQGTPFLMKQFDEGMELIKSIDDE